MLRPISFHCVRVCISVGFHFVYYKAPPRAVFSSAARDALVQMDVFSLSVRSFCRSAAVKVMALLSLPAAGISVTPRLAEAVLCRAAGWRPMMGGERQFRCGKGAKPTASVDLTSSELFCCALWWVS